MSLLLQFKDFERPALNVWLIFLSPQCTTSSTPALLPSSPAYSRIPIVTGHPSILFGEIWGDTAKNEVRALVLDVLFVSGYGSVFGDLSGSGQVFAASVSRDHLESPALTVQVLIRSSDRAAIMPRMWSKRREAGPQGSSP